MDWYSTERISTLPGRVENLVGVLYSLSCMYIGRWWLKSPSYSWNGVQGWRAQHRLTGRWGKTGVALLNSSRDSNSPSSEFSSSIWLYNDWTSVYMSSVLKHVAMFKAEIELTSFLILHSYIGSETSWLDHLCLWSYLDSDHLSYSPCW